MKAAVLLTMAVLAMLVVGPSIARLVRLIRAK